MPYQKANVSVPHLVEPVRLRFPALWEPKPVMLDGRPTGDPIYSAGIVIYAEQAQLLQQITQIQKQIATNAWISQGLDIPPGFRWALKTKAEAAPKDTNLPEDAFILNAYQKDLSSPPEMYMRDPQGNLVLLDPERHRNLIFSGVQVWASVGFFSYNKSMQNQGIGCGLNSILITGRDVGRYDAKMSGEQAFGDIPQDQAVSPVTAPPGAGTQGAAGQGNMGMPGAAGQQPQQGGYPGTQPGAQPQQGTNPAMAGMPGAAGGGGYNPDGSPTPF